VFILGTNLENCEIASLSEEQRKILEADSFWCLSKFLDGIQDNYIFAQLGIQQKVNQLKELIQRYDGWRFLQLNRRKLCLFYDYFS
jgi:TBC1 domain family member 2